MKVGKKEFTEERNIPFALIQQGFFLWAIIQANKFNY
jgi:hypothetical protein